jgi:hypothetical protein
MGKLVLRKTILRNMIDRVWAALRDHVAVCVCLCIPLSLLGNGSLKAPYRCQATSR